MTEDNLLFLETTIQAGRMFDDVFVQKKIKRNLKGKKLCTSIFVLNEFKKTFLGSLIIYHNLLVDSPSPFIALRRAGKYPQGIHKQIALIFAKLCEECGEEKIEKISVLERLEAWIEDDLAIEFFDGIEGPLIDKTSCKRVSGVPVKEGTLYKLQVSCSKNKPPACDIREFWKEYKDELNVLAISKELEKNKDKNVKKIPRVAAKVRDGKDSPFGLNCTAYLSDALIAIESPIESQVYTTNKKHFEPICEALGNRKVYQEHK